MYDKEFILSILLQIDEAIKRIERRFASINSPDDFTDSEYGIEKLDSICMMFIAIGESLKKIDKLTEGSLLSIYSDIDWKGVKGFRDIITHHYFDIDAEEVYWICKHQLVPLRKTLKTMINNLS